ncbi:MAG: YhcN/YlaJ family sporulation lipoprotein [Clostridia bacterium]|nr:YhcN/YlaJ family sporulation lipoprotein [Clostridia bacterium]
MNKGIGYFLSLALVAILVAAVLTLGGCAPRKPIPAPPAPPTAPAPPPATTPAPGAVTPAPVVPAPGTQARAADAADDIARKAAAIDGVNRAYVVVVGNVALIGVDLKKNIEGAKVERIRELAASRAKEDPRIVNAVVETDPDAVGRIQGMARGIAEGRPISDFFKEIGEFFNRAKPTT